VETTKTPKDSTWATCGRSCLAGCCEVEKKITCGSTVFSTGHPRQYSLAPAMLVCADRTRRGRFIAVWPQMKVIVFWRYRYLRIRTQNPIQKRSTARNKAADSFKMSVEVGLALFFLSGIARLSSVVGSCQSGYCTASMDCSR
jgi:hypothetical protein